MNMPEYETPQLFPPNGVSDIPEAPLEDERSQLRREVIDPGIADGQRAQQMIQGELLREPEPPNAIRADTGYNDERAEKPLPVVVTNGWSSLLGRVVQGDDDIRAQESIIDGIVRAREKQARARMATEDVERAKLHLAELHAVVDPDGSKAARDAARQAAIAEDEARRRMPPPDISLPA